jgi:hypothetical protein
MKNMEGDSLMGEIEVDETYVGGKDKNRYWNEKTRQTDEKASGKVPVIGAITSNSNIACQTIAKTRLKGNILRGQCCSC